MKQIEKKYDEQFAIVFETIQQLLDEDEKPKKKIGYIKERQAKYGKKSRKNWLIKRQEEPETSWQFV